MRLEHQIKNVVNKVVEARSDHTPGQEVGHPEHPISKKTADYEEKFFTIPGGEGKDDRAKMGVTGKPPEHPENVEDTEDFQNILDSETQNVQDETPEETKIILASLE